MTKVDMQTLLKYNAQKIPLTPEEEQACKDLEQKVLMIKEGGTTGDLIEDFELSHFLRQYLKEVHPVRELLSGVELGKLVLVERNEERNMVKIEIPRSNSPERYVVDTGLRIGILEDEPIINVTKAEITLPVTRYAQKRASWTAKWELREGPIELTILDMGYLTRVAITEAESPVPGLRVYGGDDALNYFRETDTLKAQMRHSMILNTEVVHPLRMLSYPVPEDFQQQYDSEIYQQQIKAVNQLQELLIKRRRIEQKEKPIHYGADEFQRLKNQDLKQVGDEIVSVLEGAEKYELLTTTNELTEVPGQTIKIGEFANALWEKYAVPTETK